MDRELMELMKGFAIEALENYRGMDESVYSCDLSGELTMEINNNGSVSFSTFKAKEFIKKYYDEMGEVVEYCKDNFEMTLNPFSEPETAEVMMYITYVESLVNRLPTIDAEWNEQIELSDEMIDTLISEIESVSDIEL